MTLFLEIFLAAFRAVVKLFIMCAFGAFARRKNLLGKELTKNLSSLNGTIFFTVLVGDLDRGERDVGKTQEVVAFTRGGVF